MANWEGNAAFSARIEESAGHEPWFDHYRTMFSDYKNPANAYTAFKLGSTAINIARDTWAMRAQAREEWSERFGEDVSDWPVGHPPVVLWLPIVGKGGLASGVHGFMTAETGEAT